MIFPRHAAAATALFALATLPALAQNPAAKPTVTAALSPSVLAPGPLNRNVIVLDASHGGVDGGSRIGDDILEKNVTLAFAFKLQALLQARGFTVVMPRTDDAALTTVTNGPGQPLTLDDRAGIANHARAVACLLLHATGAGAGVHLYSSELPPASGEAFILPWLTAQAAWVTQSQRLERQLATSLSRSKILLVNSTASVRPADSLTCAAVVVELAPNGDDPASINDAAYQQRVAASLADALVFWRNLDQPPPRLAPPPPPPRPAAAPADSTGDQP